MAYDLYPDVQPGDPMLAEQLNRLNAFARRKDKVRQGTGVNGQYGEVEAEWTDQPEMHLVRALQSINPGTADPTTLNARVLVWKQTTNSFVDSTEPIDLLVRSYVPIASNALFIVVFHEASGAWIPASGAGAGTILNVAVAGSAGQLTAATVTVWTDGTPPTATNGASCWALDINAGVVQTGYYIGIPLLMHAADGKIVYGVMSGFSGSRNICQDDGLATHTFTWARGALISAT
jgi:hypothetical protein